VGRSEKTQHALGPGQLRSRSRTLLAIAPVARRPFCGAAVPRGGPQRAAPFSSRRRALFAPSALAALATLTALTACGNLDYAQYAARASEKLTSARRSGAAEWAPYEITLAEAYLRKAAEEAADAEYEHASDLARDAERLSDQILRKAPGRPLEQFPGVVEAARRRGPHGLSPKGEFGVPEGSLNHPGNCSQQGDRRGRRAREVQAPRGSRGGGGPSGLSRAHASNGS
jgi:Domain of unknown function (DUF4398)